MKSSSNAESRPLPAACSGFPVLASRESLENIGYDLELYRKIVALYLDQYAVPEDLFMMLWGNDLYAIEKSADELKVVAALIGARKLSDISREIQDLAWSNIKPNSIRYGRLVIEEALNLKDALAKIDWKKLEEICSDRH